MDKRSKQHRQKQPSNEELADVTPPGASFDTEAGRAAQGMREDFDEAEPNAEDLESQDRKKSSPDAESKK